MLFDSHTHLSAEHFDADRDEIIRSLKANGVSNILEIGEFEWVESAVKMATEHDFIYASVGAHPYSAKELTENDIDRFREHTKNPKVVAIGEIGLDYHEGHDEYKDEQKYWFERQISLAQEVGLPIIVHDRDAHEDCLEIFRKTGANNGIIHCFSGDADFMRTVCDMGFYVAFGGTVTYKNSIDIQEAAKVAPIERVLIETDCPFLAPDKLRGQRNEPKYARYVAEKLAELRGLTVEEVARITSDNAKRLLLNA